MLSSVLGVLGMAYHSVICYAQASVLELTSQTSLARTKILAISKNHRKLGISPNRKIVSRTYSDQCGNLFKMENVLGVRCTTLRTLMTLENRPMCEGYCMLGFQ